jgi:hypothetical protein
MISPSLNRLVVKADSLGGVLVEAYASNSKNPVLFQRLDANLIEKGMERRKINCSAPFDLDDSRFPEIGQVSTTLKCLEVPQLRVA